MKITAINSVIALANKAFDGADTMRKAELVELLAASIKAVRALPDVPIKVAHFGSSTGEFGWSGIDAVGRRITWKSEPAKAEGAVSGAPVTPAIPAITAAMSALAGRALLMRDDQLNVLMFQAMLKLNTEDIKEWVDADALIRGVSPTAAESRR